MKLHSPALQRAYERFQQRRAPAPTETSQATTSRRHPELKLAYSPAGRNATVMFYFKIRYCTACLRGSVLDMVRELPPDGQDAHELGIRRARIWSLDCGADLSVRPGGGRG